MAQFFNMFKHKKILTSSILISSIFWLLFTQTAYSHQINDLSVKIINNDLYVSATLHPEAHFIEQISDGISKQLTFYIDLFRVWKIWPNEFLKGWKIVRILKSDPIKREYYALNIDGNTTVEKRFKDLSAMVSWAFNISDYKLTNIKDIEEGKYFVKVTVESNIKKLPPLLGYFLFFLSENEFSISKNSHKFTIPPSHDK